MMLSIEKAFYLMGDDLVGLSTENEASKNKLGSYDENGYKNPKKNS